ncbi:MAG: hypothetical protein MJ089_07730 [Ruminococcus sp.]|nr:hypothetical protein [Ruminococcus sp.]
MTKTVIKLLKLNLEAMLYSMFSFMSGKKSVATSKKSVSKKIISAIMIIFLLMVMASAYLGFFLLAYITNIDELRWAYSAIDLLVAFSFSIMSSLLAAQSYLFESKDNELLLSVPLRPLEILIGRAATLYVMNVGYSSMIMLPAMGVYGLFMHYLPINALYYIIIMLAFPLFSTAICSLFGYFLWYISSKLPSKKTANTIMGLIAMGIVIAVGMNAKPLFIYAVTHIEEATEFSQKYLFIFYWFGQSIETFNPMYIILIVLICVLSIVFSIWFISKRFVKVITTKTEAVRKKFVQKPMQRKDKFYSLVIKELGYFLSMPGYIMNGGFGTIAIILFGIFLIIKGNPFPQELLGITPATTSYPAAMIICSITAMCVVNDATASGISLEAKTLWIIKTAPVDFMKLFIAKSLLSPIITIPGILFAVISSTFAIDVNVTDIIFMILIPTASAIFAGLYGICINLILPRFDWSSEIIIIKQSGSVIITILSSLLLSLFPLMLISTTALLVDDRPVILGYIGGLLCYVLLIVIELLFLNTKGRKLFEKLA